MFIDTDYRKRPDLYPFHFSHFLAAVLLFENPISKEKLQKLLLEYNERYVMKRKGIHPEDLSLLLEYVELVDGQYKIKDGLTLEKEVSERTSLFKYFFLNSKPIIYDFLYENYIGKITGTIPPSGEIMRDMKQSDRQKPTLNDSLYRNYQHKAEIDFIRLSFYEVFGKDLKVTGSRYMGTDDNYLRLIENYYKFSPVSDINGLLTSKTPFWAGFSQDRFSGERHTSFSYSYPFVEDQGFSNDYIGFCNLASQKIGGGELNLAEGNSADDIYLRHIEYKLRDHYSGPQEREFKDLGNESLNRFIQYLASRSRIGDSQLGYLYYCDREMLKQILTEQEYEIVVRFIKHMNSVNRSYYKKFYDKPFPSLKVGPKLSFIKRR